MILYFRNLSWPLSLLQRWKRRTTGGSSVAHHVTRRLQKLKGSLSVKRASAASLTVRRGRFYSIARTNAQITYHQTFTKPFSSSCNYMLCN